MNTTTPSTDRKQGVSVRMEPDLHEKLRELADQSGVSLNTYLIAVLDDAAERKPLLKTRSVLVTADEADSDPA